MDRNELNRLRPLRREIVCRIKELHKMEQREVSAAKQGQSLMHSMTKVALAENHHERKAELRKEIFALQRQFLTKRAELEKEISCIEDQYTRLAFSLCYVDLLSAKDAASIIGGNRTAGAILAQKNRYLSTHNTPEGIDSS